MVIDTLVGRRLVRCEGLLESSRIDPPIRGYTAVIELDNGQVVLLSQSDYALIDEWPSDSTEIPLQSIDVPVDLIGTMITAVFRSSTRQFEGEQLWVLLDGQYVLGLANTQQGTKLHAEPVVTAPFMRQGLRLRDLGGNEITLDSLLLRDQP